jgi:sugar/nucleoside kinase (ribokinase family)
MMNINSLDNAAEITNINIGELITHLTETEGSLQQKTIMAGFDGFTDTLVKVIKMKEAQLPPTMFTTIGEFGQYILEKKGASLSLEMEEQNVKLGGNMPIMANALGALGATVHCIGALGFPHQHPIFESFPQTCKRYSFANPGHTTAFEFNDGKIMMGNMGELNSAGWQTIKERIGLDTISKLYNSSDLVCMLNWSEIDASTDIWKGLYNDVIRVQGDQRLNKYMFFDLADCSKRSDELIVEAIDLIEQFASHTKVILSLNKNEAGIIYRILLGDAGDKNIALLGDAIFKKMGIDMIVVHSTKESALFNAGNAVYLKSFYTSDPKISTGAGDNFNAGFCTATLLGLPAEQSLIFANAVSGYYVREGHSANLPDIKSFLEKLQSVS